MRSLPEKVSIYFSLGKYLFTQAFLDDVALRLAVVKLPTAMEFIDRSAPPRLGNVLLAPPTSTATEARAEA